MEEIIIIKTSQTQQVKQLLGQANINYKIYQEPKEGIFADYGMALQDKEREQEAYELENSEEEDITDEDW